MLTGLFSAGSWVPAAFGSGSSSALPTFLASGSQPRGHKGWGLPLQVLAAGGLRSALSQLPGASLSSLWPVLTPVPQS